VGPGNSFVFKINRDKSFIFKITSVKFFVIKITMEFFLRKSE